MTCETKWRLVVVGRNAQIWQWLRERIAVDVVELSHTELGTAEFTPADVVWIFSYSRKTDQNRSMFDTLARSNAKSIVYVSSATTNIAPDFRCYTYPAAKLAAENLAISILGARIVRLGVVYRSLDDLPNGYVATTSVGSLTEAMETTFKHGVDTVPRHLFEMVDRPFRSRAEHFAYRFYGALMALLPVPCMLRPLDALFRSIGWKWYGYLYLSNRKWSLTTS